MRLPEAFRRREGDIMSAEKRSALMARIKCKNAGPDIAQAAALAGLGVTWQTHLKDTPGRPDLVFREHRGLSANAFMSVS